MPKFTLSPFEATPLEDVGAACAQVAATFRTGRTKDVEWRKVQLRKLYWAIIDYTPQILAAIKLDLNKCEYETMLSELDFVMKDCLFLAGHLDRLAADESASGDVPLTLQAVGWRVRKEPLGPVLIIGAYNYPLLLLLSPLIGAIAAGCTAVAKPSEVAPATAMVIRELVEARLDREAFCIVNGGVPETTALLAFRDHGVPPVDGEERGWAKIFYTGGRQVARIVMAAAAPTLTPVALELGGRNPAFVTAGTPDLRLAARRLLWGKTLGAGQVCLSHNYVLVQRSVLDEFVAGLQAAFAATFPNGAAASELVHIANERHFDRLHGMLQASQGRVVVGGRMDRASLFMEPTAVLVDSPLDALVQQESFGPIFAVLPVADVSEAIRIANEVDPTPLSLFAFGSKAENAQILREVTSGGATLNDSYMHGSVHTVAFGGVGHSGTGAYRGRASFDVFSHRRTVAETPRWLERFLRVRYMPYSWRERRILAFFEPKANFDRSGRVISGAAYWVRLLFGLGSGNVKGALLRWASCLLVLFAVYWNRRYHT